MSADVFRQIAVRNAISNVRRESRFPHQIFVGEWIDYFFFYPEAMFEACFIDVKNLLLREENASTVALVNLGNVNQKAEAGPRAIFLYRDTTPQRYISELVGDGTATNWMFLMDRYVCASEKGNWVIYCEKENDVAALAVGGAISTFACSQLAKLLSAKSIRSISVPGNGQSFDFQKLVPEWKSALGAEYHLSDRSA